MSYNNHVLMLRQIYYSVGLEFFTFIFTYKNVTTIVVVVTQVSAPSNKNNNLTFVFPSFQYQPQQVHTDKCLTQVGWIPSIYTCFNILRVKMIISYKLS